jgi:hypothetical protein
MQAGKLAGPGEAIQEQSQALTIKLEKRDLVILLLLFMVQASCFLPVCFNIGFYLDDWLTFWNLHFAPHNLVDLLKAAFADPRMITRPVQCVYYAFTYFLFGDRPLGYHLLRFALEYLGAVFLYMGIKRLSLSQFVAALCALIFILYPSHDATHYWIGGGLGPGFGLTLYLASFCFSVYAFAGKEKVLYPLALISYGLSAFCYESFLPMLVMSFCSILLLAAEQRTESRLNTMGSVVWWFVPFLAVGLLEPIYQRVILPRVATIFLSPSSIDPAYFFNVFVQGLNMSFFAGLWSFLAERVREEVIIFTPTSALQIAGVLASTTGVVLVSFSNDQCVRYRRLFTAALLTFFASYLTFAVAQGYMPVLNSMINRVNIGASVAVSLVIALAIKWLIDHTGIKGKTALAVSLSITLPLVLIMVLTDLALSSFWVRSWQVQKDIRFLVNQHKDKIQEGDAILLANAHRYLNWAPVFDGTWDFQSMLAMTLNRKKQSGGVICDRLTIKGDHIQDISANFLCADYPASRITVLFPSESAWITVKTPAEFIDLANKKERELALSAGTIQRWRAEAARRP